MRYTICIVKVKRNASWRSFYTRKEQLMYFSNLLDARGVGEFQRSAKSGTIPFIGSVAERSAVGHVRLVDNKIIVDDVAEGDLFLKGIQDDSNSPFLEKYKTGLLCKEVLDTDENPMIVVLAKSIKFYVGVKTFVKFINIADDAVMACLVYGACEFTFDDGVSVALQRCNTADLDGRKVKEFSAKDLREHCSVVDKESGYNLEWDCVNAMIVNITSEFSGSYKTVKEQVDIFKTDDLEKARVRAVEKKRIAEEEAKRQAEQRKQFMAELEKKQREQEEKEAKEKADREAKKAAKLSTKKKADGFETVNLSGEAFLKIISNL